MKAIRILSLILALLMTVALLAACNDNTGDAGTDADADAGADAAAKKVTLELVDKGKPNYVVVYDYSCGPETVNAIQGMVKAFDEYLNCEIETRECYSDREVADEAPVEAKEILIGNTNREESAKAMDGKKTNDWAIEIYGEKLCITGGSDASTSTAVVRFMTGFVYEQGDKNAVKKNNTKFDLVVDSETLAADDFHKGGIYSYDKATMHDARIDSYLLIYPKDSRMTDEYRFFAEEMQAHITKETGYVVDVYKDTRVKGDYEVLIGDTVRTDEGLIEKLDDDEYYIALEATETGAVMTILFGSEAYDAAMAAFKTMMPVSVAPIDFHVSDGFVLTNMQ